MRLREKAALVTGAGSGIGKGIAESFAREGAKVVVNDINPETGLAVTEGILQKGGMASFIPGDVSSEADAEKMVRFTVDTYGKIDILVNNAGTELVKPTHELTVEEWDRVMNVVLKGVFLLSKHTVRQMLAQGKGSIVNLASLGALVGFPLLGSYCAAKGGVLQLTRAMALEYRAANIRVNAICPGQIKTGMLSRFMDVYRGLGYPIDDIIAGLQHRLGEVEEVAAAAVFLASDEASLINGIALPVDNGGSAS
ncbi:MAG: SDR family NAD(P)-dependent oxidoreductase [Bacillota bacterium]